MADLVTTGNRGSSVDVWIGNGDGSYQPPVSYQVGSQPQGLVLADLNNDGNLDIVAADAGDSNANHAIAVLLGNGDGTFKPVQYVAGLQGIFDVTAVDFDGDGKMDLAAVCPNQKYAEYLHWQRGRHLQESRQLQHRFKSQLRRRRRLQRRWPTQICWSPLIVGDGGDIDVALNKGNGQLQIPPFSQSALRLFSLQRRCVRSSQ